jgi:hypothetical protein
MATRPYTVLYGGVENGELRIDGQSVSDGTEWVRMLKRSVIFVDSTVKAPHLTALMSHPDDTASGQPGNVNGVTLRTITGSVKIIRGGDVWGIPARNIDELSKGMERIRTLCDDNGITWRPTAAGTSVEIAMNLCKGIGPFTGSRWRLASYAAIHAGPMTHVRGGAPRGIHIDRRSAYLAEMSEPMPNGELYLMDGEVSVSRHLSKPGLVYCQVNVAHTEDTNQLPPLPVSTKRGRMLYPVGTFRGIWPSNMLREAVESGEIEVVKVFWSIRWTRMRPVLQPFVARMEGLPKELAKPLYTRLWGKMSAQGGWTGRLHETGKAIPSGELFWQCNARPQHSTRLPPYHRPDMAAWIVGLNHANVVRTVRATKPETLIAAHVDAIWTSDVEGARKLCGSGIGDWKEEATGRIRYYSQGRYYVQSPERTKIGYSGWPHDNPPTLAEFARWASSHTEGKQYVRGWLTKPETDPNAKSVAPELISMDNTVINGYLPSDSEYWASGGRFKSGWQSFLDGEDKQRERNASAPCIHGITGGDCDECL